MGCTHMLGGVVVVLYVLGGVPHGGDGSATHGAWDGLERLGGGGVYRKGDRGGGVSDAIEYVWCIPYMSILIYTYVYVYVCM